MRQPPIHRRHSSIPLRCIETTEFDNLFNSEAGAIAGKVHALIQTVIDRIASENDAALNAPELKGTFTPVPVGSSLAVLTASIKALLIAHTSSAEFKTALSGMLTAALGDEALAAAASPVISLVPNLPSSPTRPKPTSTKPTLQPANA